nr:SDR family NAD(P)-dependent oxidoreductase [uncultured Sphingomonas sp.]
MTGALKGRRAVITGAGSGIGRAIALLFAREGGRVVLVDRDRGAITALLPLLSGSGHEAAGMDVTSEADWHRLAEVLADGGCDILVNNAGQATLKPIAELSLAEWRGEMATNLDSVFLGSKALLPLLAASGRGAIVNISSIRGIIGGNNATAYCASKGAVRLFTKAMALEWAELGSGIRVNSIHPGLIETPMAAAAMADPDVCARRMASLPLGRPGRVEEIASAVLFAASEASSYMTGAEIVVDGGTVAQ